LAKQFSPNPVGLGSVRVAFSLHGNFNCARDNPQCVEVRFKWHNVHQYRPVPLQIVREIWKARPMNTALQELVMKDRRIRFDELRSEGKLLVSLLRGWALIAPERIRNSRCTNDVLCTGSERGRIVVEPGPFGLFF
jgi:hypothetical protein